MNALIKRLLRLPPPDARDIVRAVYELHGLQAALLRAEELNVRPPVAMKWIWTLAQIDMREAVQ